MAAGLKDSGDLTQRDFRRESMQGLRGGHDIEVTRQKRQRLDMADHVQPGAKASRQIRNEFHGAIDAEHLMTGSAQHRGETTAAGSEVEDPHPFGTDHPRGCGVRIGSTRLSHGGNFSGARPAS
jgi:hypothetical protein